MIKAAKLIPIENQPSIEDKRQDVLAVEVNLLKEALNQEKQKRETFFNDISRQYQEVFQTVYKNEGQVLSKVQKQREELVEQIRRTKEQQQKLETYSFIFCGIRY